MDKFLGQGLGTTGASGAMSGAGRAAQNGAILRTTNDFNGAKSF